MLAHPCNVNTQSEAGGFLRIQGQPSLHRAFQASQSFVVRPCLKNKKEILTHLTTKVSLENTMQNEIR